MSSAPLPLPEQLAQLRTLIGGAQLTRYATISTWALLIWDHGMSNVTNIAISIPILTRDSATVISFEQEVRISNADYH